MTTFSFDLYFLWFWIFQMEPAPNLHLRIHAFFYIRILWYYIDANSLTHYYNTFCCKPQSLMKMQQKVLKKKIAEIIVSMIMHYSTNFHRFLLCDDEIRINYALGGLKYFVLILAF